MKILTLGKRNYFIVLSILLVFSYASSQTYMENFGTIGEEFIKMGNDSYFFAASERGMGLWKTDGTQKGTTLVSSFSVNEYDVGREMIVYNQSLYFSAKQSTEEGVELWKSDGTSEGTYRLKNINPSGYGDSRPADFIVYKGLLYFSAVDYYTTGGKRRIFRTDGTQEGTVLADNIVDDYSSFNSPVIRDEKLYFSSGSLLYETDGAPEGTSSVTIDGLQNISSLKSFDSGLYFITHNSNNTYIRLYRLSGLDNYEMLKEFSTENYGGLEFYGLSEVGGKVVFSVVSGQTYKDVKDTLWSTDGTPDGTVELMSQGGDDSLWFQPHFYGFVEYNGDLYFNAGPAANSTLWKTNGTTQGTMEVLGNVSIWEDAPMIVLGDKLFFLSFGGHLTEFDFFTQESKPVWPLKSYRRSTADIFFIKTDGQFIYAAVQNEREDIGNNFDLFHTKANPLINVITPQEIKNNESLSFSSKVDSLIVREINIQNLGNSNLVFSDVFVSGEGFYINGDVEVAWGHQENQTQFPRRILPKERGLFEVGFLPSFPGNYNGYLVLRSNDTSQPEFKIKLKGYASEFPADSLSSAFSLNKELMWDVPDAKIELDNNKISKGVLPGSAVGAFSTNSSDTNYRYEFVEGPGGEDNVIFTIDNNQLIVGERFGENKQNSYSIHVKSIDNVGVEVDGFFVLEVTEVSIDVELQACEMIAISLTSDIYDVDFINETDAIAAGNNGTVLKTYDKGLNWEQIQVMERSNLLGNSPYPSTLYRVDFVDENTGFILGEETILRTDDAGMSWKPLSLDGIRPNRDSFIKALSTEKILITVNNFSSSNYLYESNDGGKTWAQAKNFGYYDLISLYFYDDNFGMVSDDYENYYITQDGGITWEIHKLEVDGLNNEDITSFSFIDSTTGYASTSGRDIIKTEDGGITWNLINSDYRSWIDEIHFLDENQGFIVGGALWETSDGGITWNTAELSLCSDISGFSSNNQEDILVVGGGCYTGNGRSIHYNSFGGEWTEVSSLIGTREVRSIIFDGDEGYLFSTSQTRKSYDQGTTWNEITMPTEEEKYNGEKIGSTLFVYNNLNNYYKSIDSGENWTEILKDESINFDINDIISDSLIMGRGADGRVLKSENGGDTWVIIDGSSYFPHVFTRFINENIGFSLGLAWRKTEDGGVTWVEIDSDPSASYISKIKFIGNVGLMSTDDGFYRTVDEGDTWVRVDRNFTSTRNIIALSELEWYIGIGRTIYQSNDGGLTWDVFFQGQYSISDMDFDNGNLYISNDDGEVLKLIEDPSPLNAGYIQGDQIVRVGDQEIYEVLKHSDNKYVWTVTEPNSLVSEDNFARITWEAPGTYVLEVTPYATCSTGAPTQITVQVLKEMTAPEIIGPSEVIENSKEIVYSTPNDEQARYIWSVSGDVSYYTRGNELIVDWDTVGEFEIGLIKTDLISGVRADNQVFVVVVPTDPFTLLQSDASCRGMSNGSLQITSRLEQVTYYAILSNDENTFTYEFTGETILEDLAIGTYNLCIEEIDGEKKYCYQFIIGEPEPFEVSSKKGTKSSKEVKLEFKGGLSPYTILLNGHQIAETSQSTYNLRAENGDKIEVLSSSNCSFSHTEIVYFSNEPFISPNPVKDSFTVVFNDNPVKEKQVSINIFTLGGQLVSESTVVVVNNSFHYDISSYPPGMYIVEIGNSQQTLLKIVKK
ncbi:ELWxxDGT repeat protein [Saonia flava]|uniref:ELWxxDGT repeat protein n=1 Tax=Saonia flava TaxID=523696 RepID=A0A846R0E5_9FLAO|nr:YCF48-related protein [Saonia flava]NJB72630.1 ELWxxDGT repeat protein [Saonia flava]